MSTPTIYAALAAVMGDVKAVAKNDRNEHQRFMFRGIDAVVNAVGPALRAHGVIVVPEVLDVAYDDVQTTSGKSSTACRVRVAYTFWGPAGDSIRTVVVGESWDAGDKAAPKAMSVAFRTALLQSLALPTDEPDPDEHVFERAPQTPQREVSTAEVALPKGRDASLPSGEAPPAADNDEFSLICGSLNALVLMSPDDAMATVTELMTTTARHKFGNRKVPGDPAGRTLSAKLQAALKWASEQQKEQEVA